MPRWYSLITAVTKLKALLLRPECLNYGTTRDDCRTGRKKLNTNGMERLPVKVARKNTHNPM